MPAPKLRDIPWNEIRILYVTESMTLAEMARRFHIPETAIKARSKRGRWAKEREARLAQIERERGPAALIPPDESGLRRLKPDPKQGDIPSPKISPGKLKQVEIVEGEVVTHAVSTGKAIETIETPVDLASDVWARRKLEHREVAYELSHGAVKAATRGKNKLKTPGNWKDVDIAEKMARRTLGLDDDSGPKINVLINLGALNGALKSV